MDSRVKQKGKFLDMVGWYDPVKSEDNVFIKKDVAEKWLRNGATPTETVMSILKKSDVEIPEKKPRADKRNRVKKA